MFAETYGPPGVQALTRASRLFLAEAAGTSFPSLETSLLTARGVLWAVSEESSRLDHGLASLPGATELSAAQCRAMCPALREDFVLHGFFEPDAMDMDVAALHQGFMGEARKRGATFVFDAAVARATQHGAGGEILDKTIYDTAILAAATTVHRLFTVPLGGGAPAKTLDRTNMTQGGQMPQGQNLAVGKGE